MTTLDLAPSTAAPPVAMAAVAHRSSARAIKHAGDRLLAGLLLLALAVPLLVLAAVVAATSRGPVIFRQTRYGLDGRPFTMWKFRTMVAGAAALPAPANEADGLLFKVRVDPRVTRLGGLLRKWSLDELPQLVNVLLGHMSLVGPRPLPVHPSAYTDGDARRLAVRPGITGLWQVSGRSDLTWRTCVHLDLTYIDSWSLWLDVQILFRTVGAVARRAGAY